MLTSSAPGPRRDRRSRAPSRPPMRSAKNRRAVQRRFRHHHHEFLAAVARHHVHRSRLAPQQLAIWRSTESPAIWPRVSLICLKRSMSGAGY